MLDVSKERNIGFLRAATKYLQEKVLLLEKQVAEQKKLAILDAELCKLLSEDLLLLRKKFFGRSSEKSSPKVGRRRKAKPANLLHNQRPTPDIPQPYSELHSEEVIHTLPSEGEGDKAQSCACTDGSYQPMTNTFEESCEVHVTERQYLIKRHKRQKYKCDHCSKIIAAPGPAKLVPGGSFSMHMAAQIADDKYHRHIPLNRQREMMAERGLHVDTKTLYSLLGHLMNPLEKVQKLIKAEILSHSHLHIDETPMPLLLSKENGYVWAINNKFGVFYQYETTRSKAIAKELIGKYQGIVMSDGYAGYEFLDDYPGITHVMCLSHARRKFVDAAGEYPQAQQVIDLFDDVYAFEHEANSFDELSVIRREKSAEKVEKIDSWIELQSGKYLDRSLLGKAIGYWKGHHKKLTSFLKNSQTPIDNNAGEREMRRPVMGRKNFQGFRTIDGADLGMFYYTIIGTCRLLAINPRAYLLEMGLRAAQGQTVITPIVYAGELNQKAEAGNSLNELYQSFFQ